MQYDPAGHPLLSTAATQLDPVALDAHAEAAEWLLGRGGVSLADTAHAAGTPEHDRAILAVVFQVNHQVAMGADLGMVKSWTRGGRSVVYRDGSNAWINPTALALLLGLVPDDAVSAAWPIAEGLR